MYPHTNFLIILIRNKVKFRPGMLSQCVKYIFSILKNKQNNSFTLTQATVTNKKNCLI